MVLKSKPGYFGVVRGTIHSTDTSYNEYRRLLDEDRVDTDYRLYLLDCHVKQKNVESKRKQRGEDDEPDYNCYREGNCDPQYELFLGRLKEDGKSYILESFEYKGKMIKYEGVLSSDTESDKELRRKPSAMKPRDGPSTQMPRVENRSSLDSQSTPSTDIEGLIRRQTRNQSRIEKEKNAKLSTKNTVPHSTYPRSTRALKEHSSLDKDCNPEPERMLRSGRKQKIEHFNEMCDVSEDDSQSTPTKEMEKPTRRSLKNKPKREKEDDIVQLDPDYYVFSQNLKVVNNRYYAYMDTTHRVVYELKGGESNQVKEEYNDGSYSDVEILDSTTFNKMHKGSMPDHGKSSSDSEFRHKVIIALRKPFDEVELKKLWNDINLRKPEERHLDLRNGRERSYGKQKDGKSYLDHCSDLKKMLLLVKDDNKPKFLNLLRGFFLWLKHPGAFSPWLDGECLSIYPESR